MGITTHQQVGYLKIHRVRPGLRYLGHPKMIRNLAIFMWESNGLSGTPVLRNTQRAVELVCGITTHVPCL